MRKALILIGITVVATVSFYAVFAWQRHVAVSLEGKHDSLTRQVNDLQKQYAAAEAEANIGTGSWKRYCDPVSSLCFKYPPHWTLEGGEIGDFDRVDAMLANSEKTVRIRYESPLVKDGGLMGIHVVKVVDLTVGGTKLRIIGGYPVSSGTYRPSYMVLNGNSEYAKDIVPGKIALGVINARFDIGKYDAIYISGSPADTTFTSSAQAEAWFDSVDGKTVLKVIESFSAK